MAAGQGTTSNVSIGTLGGSFLAPEDTTAGSGVMSDTTINSITSSGMVSTGSISGMSVGTAASGSFITAAGQGTTSGVSIGTLSGSFTAPEDLTAPAGTTTGVMSNTNINSITSTGTVSTGSFSGMAVGTASGNPRVVVQILTAGSVFDLGVTTSTATNPGAGFDLAGLYSAVGGPSGVGIHNVVIGGNLRQGAVPAGAISFFGLPVNTTG